MSTSDIVAASLMSWMTFAEDVVRISETAPEPQRTALQGALDRHGKRIQETMQLLRVAQGQGT